MTAPPVTAVLQQAEAVAVQQPVGDILPGRLCCALGLLPRGDWRNLKGWGREGWREGGGGGGVRSINRRFFVFEQR